MHNIIEIKNLNKVYENNYKALDNVNLDIKKGEIIALLGPNGAGKTSLISNVCGISSITSGKIHVEGKDVEKDFRKTRHLIGLVPQELSLEPFEKVWASVKFSRQLFGKKKNDLYLKDLLKKLSLWDKQNQIIKSLSGGMKRRVLIAKALSHEPKILFLDEPTAVLTPQETEGLFEVMDLLRRQGKSIIFITHKLKEVLRISMGSPEEILMTS